MNFTREAQINNQSANSVKTINVSYRYLNGEKFTE